MSLLAWSDLPAELREGVEARLEAKISSTVDSMGHGPHDYSGTVFSAIGSAYVVAVDQANRVGVQALQRELRVNRFLRPIAPRCIWTFESMTWTVAGFESVIGERPNLGPGSADLVPVVRMLVDLTETGASYLRPGDESILRHAAQFESLASRLSRESAWRTLTTNSPRVLDPWDRRRASQFVEHELLLFDVLSGGLCAVHGNVSSSSVLLTASGPRLTGWHDVAKAPDWVDPAVFAVHLVADGHSPEDAEGWVAQVPAWKKASTDSIDAFAVSLLGRWLLAGRSVKLKTAVRQYVKYRLERRQ
ncbi:hypothetical protein [Amycolatopsis vastitatis]|uniref:hypothetical protein n=1 Tax=Amycolatopsis vastitatis TaxID=1905142 RepID=UPI0011787326|nr:hypothetical protein [Amycolatopsis vastitatis]